MENSLFKIASSMRDGASFFFFFFFFSFFPENRLNQTKSYIFCFDVFFFSKDPYLKVFYSNFKVSMIGSYRFLIFRVIMVMAVLSYSVQ